MSQRLAVFYQTSDMSRQRTIDWAAPLSGDTVGTSTWTVSPSGLTTVATGASSTTTSIQLTGGSPGVEYRVENAIVTAGGQRLRGHLLITVIA
jgi:hypothetical protein